MATEVWDHTFQFFNLTKFSFKLIFSLWTGSLFGKRVKNPFPKQRACSQARWYYAAIIRERKQQWRQWWWECQKSSTFSLAKQQLCTCIMFFCTFLCCCYAITMWKCLISHFVEEGNTRQQCPLYFFWNLIQSVRIQFEKNKFDHDIWRIKRDGIQTTWGTTG